MIITGIHCQCIAVKAPTVIAPTAFHIVATKIIVCMIALLSSKPNTPTKVNVANRPAPEESDPENMPIIRIHMVPRMVLV